MIIMVRTPEEIKTELEELKIKREDAERQYKRVLAAGFKKHKECCSDVCETINQVMLKLNYNITKANSIKEKTISRIVKMDLSKDIIKAEFQLEELKNLKEQLYAKQVCDCK